MANKSTAVAIFLLFLYFFFVLFITIIHIIIENLDFLQNIEVD